MRIVVGADDEGTVPACKRGSLLQAITYHSARRDPIHGPNLGDPDSMSVENGRPPRLVAELDRKTLRVTEPIVRDVIDVIATTAALVRRLGSG